MTEDEARAATAILLANTQKVVRDQGRRLERKDHDLNEALLYLNRAEPNVEAALTMIRRALAV